jgi:chemotaxis protein histidine kinase CheA
LGTVADAAERSSVSLRRTADTVQWRSREMRSELSSLRRSSVRELLERVVRATEGFAARESRLVRIVLDSDEAPVDRDVADRLFDPLLQLAKNALVHGIESTTDRAVRGKPSVGTITVSAERVGDWLRLSIADDGRGIDVDALRAIALRRGALRQDAARAASDDELLSLLFLPGLTTQSRADVLAGRGIGLDLAQSVAHRLGGSLRLNTRVGSGVTATLEVPIERSVVDVVWLQSAGESFALPLRFSGQVQRAEASVVSLARCLSLAEAQAPRLAIELVVQGDVRAQVGIDAVGSVEEVHLRPLPPLRSEWVPFGAAVLCRDGALRFALDAQAVAARVWQAGR